MKYLLTVWLIEHTSRSISSPSGEILHLARPYGLSVSFIAALSQWRKQFSLSLAFVITSVSICVHHCYKEYFHRMNADRYGTKAKHLVFWAKMLKPEMCSRQ